MKNKRIYITGADGGIGSDLVDFLSEKNYEIFSNTSIDILNKEKITESIVNSDPDVVIHLAAMVGTKDCEEVPEQAIETNVIGTFNVVKAAVKAGAKVIYFSTTAIYKPGVEPIKEDSPVGPYTIYGKTKYWGEEIAKLYVPKKDLLIIRPCFGFGGRTDVSMLGALIRSSITKKRINLLLSPINKKDYSHVRNFSNAVYKLIEADKFGDDYNLSYGKAIQYQEIIEKLNSHNIYPFFKMFPDLDYMGNHIVSSEKLQKAIGKFNIISLDEGIEKVVNQYKK